MKSQNLEKAVLLIAHVMIDLLNAKWFSDQGAGWKLSRMVGAVEDVLAVVGHKASKRR